MAALTAAGPVLADHAQVTLLVPIDPSSPSRWAVALAARIAPALGEDVLLLHVCAQIPSLDQLAALHRLARPIRDAGVPVRLRTTQGPVVERIVEVASARHCALILMGTRGHAAESVARAVMNRSTVPVAAARPPMSEIDRPTPRVEVSGSLPGPARRRLADALAASHGEAWRWAGDDPGPPAPGRRVVLLSARDVWRDDALGPSGASAAVAEDARLLVVVSD